MGKKKVVFGIDDKPALPVAILAGAQHVRSFIAGSITAVTNSTIVAIRLHLLIDKRRRMFSASLSYIH